MPTGPSSEYVKKASIPTRKRSQDGRPLIVLDLDGTVSLTSDIMRLDLTRPRFSSTLVLLATSIPSEMRSLVRTSSYSSPGMSSSASQVHYLIMLLQAPTFRESLVGSHLDLLAPLHRRPLPLDPRPWTRRPPPPRTQEGHFRALASPSRCALGKGRPRTREGGSQRLRRNRQGSRSTRTSSHLSKC
jgi:hypothetical protein